MSTAAPLQTQVTKPKPLSNSNHSGLLVQRKCACGSPTSSLAGECAECKSKKLLQTKLTLGASNDPLEQEADRVADQVLAAPANPAISGAPTRIQRLTRLSTGPSDSAPHSVDRVLTSPGRPLEPALRHDMEQRFGHDFSRVRVHSHRAAEQSAREVNANAYTVGHNIVFGAGRFAPGTRQGRRLIAHELTHVVQQGRGAPILQREGSAGKEFEPCGQAGWGNSWLFVGDIGSGPYVNQGISLPYDKIVPLPDPTKGYDEGEVKKTFRTPARLEQLYYDASTVFENRYRAVWLVCNAVELGARHIGAANAASLYTLGCLAGSLINRTCYTDWDKVLRDFSEGTASGRRVRGLTLKGYVDKSFELDLDLRLINSALLLLGAHSAARAALSRPGPLAVSLDPPQPTFGPGSKPIQGGGQKITPPREGHLRSINPSGNLQPPTTVKPPPDPGRGGGVPNRPTGTQAVNDNAVPMQSEQQLAKTGTDAGRPRAMADPKESKSSPTELPTPQVPKIQRPNNGGQTPFSANGRRQRDPMQEQPVKPTKPPEDTHSVGKGAPGALQPESFDVGNFAEKNFNALPDALKRAGIPSKKPISERVPKDARKFKIKGYRGSVGNSNLPEIDALDRANGVVIEIKPHHLYEQGLAEAKAYAQLMDKLHPLPPLRTPTGEVPQRWKAKCITYDGDAVGEYVRRLRSQATP